MAKKKRVMKKQVRRTLGALFLASSVVVAAIPTSSYRGGEAQADTSTYTQPVTKYETTTYTGGTDGGMEPGISKDSAYAQISSSVPYARSQSTPNDYVNTDVPIYTTSDSRFQFAYVDKDGFYDSAGKRFAMILGYNNLGDLPNNTLTIPDTLDTYKMYRQADGTLCAVAADGNFLYYRTETSTSTEMNATAWAEYQTTHASDANTVIGLNNFDYRTSVRIVINGEPAVENGALKTDENGEQIYLVTTYNYTYLPCYSTAYDTWSTINDEELFFYTDGNFSDDTKRMKVGDTTNPLEHYRIKATVAWIGKQYLTTDATKGWVLGGIVDDKNGTTQGVFVGDKSQNIVTLNTGDDFQGIGCYAFYGVSGLQKYSSGNALATIEDRAFMNCISLSEVSIPKQSVSTIGREAFRNCGSLTSFVVPRSVSTICDGAFLGCTKLSSLDMLGGESSNTLTSLNRIGYYVFQGCEALSSVVLPEQITDNQIDISMFQGCYSLQNITVTNASASFRDAVTTTGSKVDYTLQDFLMSVPATFYFAGPAPQPYPETTLSSLANLHSLCRNNTYQKYEYDESHNEVLLDEYDSFAYKFNGYDVYEKAVKGSPTEGTVIFQVNSSNELLQAKFDETSAVVKTLVFPANIGPYHIVTITDNAFANKCNLETITLPESITQIGSGAFKGCHNVSMVTFKNDSVSIGDDAFRTQAVTLHANNCPDGLSAAQVPPTYPSVADPTDPDYPYDPNSPKVKLHFITTISADSTPYMYAMSQRGKYNHGDQAISYPIVYSGWPTCLEVTYNQTKDCAELVNFPTKSTINDYTVAANTPYMTDSQRNSASGALALFAANAPESSYTEEQLSFIHAMDNLTIPTGVGAIKDGLFKTKVSTAADAMGVIIYGLTDVEVDYQVTGTIDSADNVHTHHTVDINSGAYEAGNTGFWATDIAIDFDKSDFAGCPYLTSVTFAGTDAIDVPDGAFFGCTGLTGVSGSAPIDRVGDRAFGNCTNLASVDLQAKELGYHAFENDANLSSATFSSNLTQMSAAPFWGCEKLSDVNFNGSGSFTCENSIIYNSDKSTLIQSLPGRASKNIRNADVAGVTTLSQEAFANTPLTAVDLSGSSIGAVPDFTFKDTTSIATVILPTTCGTIGNYAFDGTALADLEVNNGNILYAPNAFDHMTSTGYDGIHDSSDHTNNANVEVFAPANSNFYNYAKLQGYTVSELPASYNVVFWDYTDASPDDMVIVDTQTVLEGKDAIPPAAHGKTGSLFIGWNPSYENVTSDLNCFAKYSEDTVTITFFDYDGTELSTVKVPRGSDATIYAPNPTRDGYEFTGWDRPITAVSNNLETYATYATAGVSTYTVSYYNYDGTSLYYTALVEAGGTAPDITGPARDGYVFTGWDKDLTNIQSDLSTVALYVEADTTHTVTYYTYDGLYVFQVYEVKDGEDAPYIMGPEREGYTFTGWDQILTNVTADIDTIAQYVEQDVVTHTVNYYTYDGATLYYTIQVIDGENAPDIQGPEREGYTFSGWDRPLTNITNDMDTVAQYVSNADYDGEFTVNYYTYDGLSLFYTATVGAGEDAPMIMGPEREGYYFTGWDRPLTNVTSSFDTRAVYSKNGGGDDDGDGDGDGDGDTKKKFYTLTVVNGSGSGSYVQGSQVIIVADDPASGKVFDKWTVSPEATVIASKVLPATVITMPGEPVTVTA
ncbi:MAG: leucine-rich repeat protein, partial [Lachnospiraceae bacterium]|nr:leucine-rich repeat protein [Lachnospiraceae bacterium]